MFLNLPVSKRSDRTPADGKERPLPPEKYYIPGSLLTVSVDNTNPVAYGMPKTTGRVLRQQPGLPAETGCVLSGTSPVAWFANGTPLHSGWAWGQQYLDGGTAIAVSSLGSGKVFLLGPEVAFRGQPHATFKFIFNSVYLGSAKGMPKT